MSLRENSFRQTICCSFMAAGIAGFSKFACYRAGIYAAARML
jgi:hypothetical protein